MKKIIMYVIVAILVVIVSIGFVKIFAFEKESTKDDIKQTYPEVNKELIDKLYSYIPISDDYERTTMYSNFYTKFQILSQDVVQSMVYNFIIKHDEFKLLGATINDLRDNNVIKSYESENDFKALYKIKLSDFENAKNRVFGKEEKLISSSFNITANLKAFYIEDDSYIIYEQNSNLDRDEFVVKKAYDKYILTDDNNTIKIYDYYIKCNVNTSDCYNDEKKTMGNRSIKNIDGVINFENNLSNAQGYVHTFKFEDGYYYWYSSELAS